MSSHQFVPLAGYREYHVDEMKQRAVLFYEQMQQRRTVRRFSNRPVPREIIEHAFGRQLRHRAAPTFNRGILWSLPIHP